MGKVKVSDLVLVPQIMSQEGSYLDGQLFLSFVLSMVAHDRRHSETIFVLSYQKMIRISAVTA